MTDADEEMEDAGQTQALGVLGGAALQDALTDRVSPQANGVGTGDFLDL